jgi:hypothetical protein
MKSGELWICIHDDNIWKIVRLVKRASTDSGEYCEEGVVLELVEISKGQLPQAKALGLVSEKFSIQWAY